MSILSYYNDDLTMDGKGLNEFTMNGPCYVYSKNGITNQIENLKEKINSSLSQKEIYYAVKANHHEEILKIIYNKGLGVDVVSGGEMTRVLKAGFPPQKIVFSGVAKTEAEIQFALDKEIRQLNVESLSELRRISEIARRSHKKIEICLRFNPEVNPQTHPYIATGFKENKFGIFENQINEGLEWLRQNENVFLVGLSMHIGSQLLDFLALKEALTSIKKQYANIQAQGFSLNRIDIGGGIGIQYELDSKSDIEVLKNYAQVLKESLGDFSGIVQMEPGRVLTARSGVLLTQIQYIKKTPYKNFIIVNSGMHHFIRPALYQAYHRILPLKKRAGQGIMADVVGPVCETADCLGRQREFTNLKEGDWLAVLDCGAYGSVMSSGYNSFDFPQEVFF